ncbi:hypothetical protein DOTSEDRAFT_55457 [Dothistroma septosporum NZE10]|uniref:Topoisomerase 1-associated factor 1 n=1 Tax=Dothistroma septosporum (strain NZE10 / CBS 128990) TaxID=675120 RepID=N1PKA8_DOTSN|nr:hypothetical protein DOTSEDRAFT_55457 [Dothistroma septosporum NZE10]
MDPWEKSTTVDPEVRAYVTSLVNAVGGRSTYDDSYSVGDDAIAVLKDLQRWLRLYDEKTNRLDVKRCLAEANLVKGDLLEILALWPEDAFDNKHKSKLALACLELLVPLTWPIALEDEKATVNHHRHVPHLQLAQVGYKRAVLHFEFAHILRTAVRVGLTPMAQPRRERSRRDEGILKLVMYFFRNIAMITQPQHLPSQGDENEISRSSTIEAFHEQDVFTALLTIGSGMGDEFQEQDVIMLEILFHLLKGVDARKLFMKKEQVTTEETSELEHLMRKEKAMINSYNKHAPTRHNRFGTMIWVKRDEMKMSTVSGQTSITDENTTLQQMDSSKRWNKPQYRGKVSREFDENSDFGTSVDLTEAARKQLWKFVEDFLDSSFNPLFVSLRKAIEREADRVQTSMHNKQYFFLISWFLSAEAARRDTSRRDSAWSADRATETTSDDNTFAYIAAVLDQETFVLLNRQMQSAFDNKSWQDLQATLLCFTQILLTVQGMSESKDEEDLEIAENIQNRIFYEEATHDRIVQILRGYTHQGFAYLDAVTECVHVFVRMLERYAKQNVDMQIRSKRRARKKQKPKDSGEAGADGEVEDAAEDERDAHRTVSERKFDFARFSTKFLSQQCVNTFISLTHFYRDLSPVQLKRAHRFFYRLAFKHELVVLLFRADIIALFHKLIKGPEGLDSAIGAFKDWEQLVQQVFRRCTKWMERQTEGEGWKEAAVVEMLFSKIPGTMFYLQNGFEKVVEKRAPRPPAELEVRATVAEEQRIGVAVSVMIEQAKVDGVTWVKKLLEDAAKERQAWEAEQAVRSGMIDEGEDGAAIQPASCPSIFLLADNDERKMALFRDKHLRLLLTTLGLQRLGLAEDADASWIIPSELTSFQLSEALDQIRKAEFDPPTFDDNKNAEDFVRSKAKRPTFDDNDSDSDRGAGSGGGLDEAMFPPNIKEKRKKRAEGDQDRPRKRRRRNSNAIELTEEELNAKRKAKEKKDREKNSKIKSNLYVTAEDDESDEEADAEFFRQEEERRKKTDGMIRGALLKQMENAEKELTGAKGKKKGAVKGKAAKAKAALKSAKKPARKKRKANDRDSDEDQIMIDAGDESTSEPPSPSTSTRDAPIQLSDNDPSSSELEDDESDKAVDSDAEGEKETPSTSPTPAREVSSSRLLKEVSANAGTTRAVDSDDEDDMPVSKPAAARRNVRAGFIIEDSDDE